MKWGILLETVPQLTVLIVLLLFFSAFFSAAEMALTAASKAKMQVIAGEYPFFQSWIDWAFRKKSEIIPAILVGNNLVNVAASAVAVAISTELFQKHGVMVSVAVMSVLIILFGEVMPKCLAMARGDMFLLAAIPLLRFCCVVFTPLTMSMTGISSLLSRVTGIDFSLRDSSVTRAEIEQVVKIGEASGALEEDERQMIDSVIAFDEIRVSEIMVPRTRMRLIDSDRTVGDALRYIQDMGDSRVPVYTETPDHIDGIVLVKDLLIAFSRGEKDSRVTEVMRQPLFVPETMFVPQLFKLMRKQRMHMALVIDEYGGTAGLITMEDLLEEIVGEIQDEYDAEDQPVTKLPDGSFKVLASVSLEDMNEGLGSAFENDNVDSLAGFLLDSFGNFPAEGQSVTVDGWTFVVSKMDGHRIAEVLVKKGGNPGHG